MQEPELAAIGCGERFQFACDPGVACFNLCCRDLVQALTPFDVLRLRSHLGLSWDGFGRHAVLEPGPSTGLPVASLRFATALDRRCPFVTPDGCSVYTARPTSCRLYPVARALHRSRGDGRIREHFALIREGHCRGFEQGSSQTVSQWIEEQDAREGLAADDLMLDLIALKNRLRPGRLDPQHYQWVVMALYDLDRLRQQAIESLLPAVPPELETALPDGADGVQWLSWGLAWIRQALFGAGGQG